MNLTKVIEAQSDHSGTLPSVLFDEVAQFVDKNLHRSTLVDEVRKPESTLESENFQYLVDGLAYTVINKFFK